MAETTAATTVATRGSGLPARAANASLRERVAAVLDAAIADAERRHPGAVSVLDAGCGHRSPLVPFRPRIASLVGIDIHPPTKRLAYLDAFEVVDLCDRRASLPAETFDVVLSNFTLEHFSNPDIAIGHLYKVLQPGGTMVLVTVNRRHPFVAAYLGLPDPIRHRLQRYLKASAADAHRLVGVCNDPERIENALRSAGCDRIELETVANLARAWGRHRSTRLLGRIGDLLLERSPSRRSTIVASASKPEGRPAT